MNEELIKAVTEGKTTNLQNGILNYFFIVMVNKVLTKLQINIEYIKNTASICKLQFSKINLG